MSNHKVKTSKYKFGDISKGLLRTINKIKDHTSTPGDDKKSNDELQSTTDEHSDADEYPHTDEYPDVHVQAAIIQSLESENQRLRQELRCVRAELQQYKQRQPINLDEKFMDHVLDEIQENEDEKELIDNQEENNQKNKPKKIKKKKLDWEKIDDALRSHSADYIKDLIINHDINLNETDSRHKDMTLLMKCCIFGNYDIAELLINCEARIDCKSDENDDCTALNYSEKWANYHISQLLQFEELGASVSTQVKHKIDLLHKQNGISQCALNNLNNNVLDGIVGLIMHCIDNKLPFSDDMMHIAFSYIKKTNKKPMDSPLFQLLLATYSKIVGDTLNKRDWSWLQRYLIKSTIWLNTYQFDTTRTLFNELFIGADKANKKLSKDLLLSNITKMRQKHSKLWRELKKFYVKDCENPTGANQVSVVRQDQINGGIKAQYTKKQLLRHKPYGINFNPINHYDFNEYLNKLYFRATMVDDKFQNDIKYIMNKIISEDNSIGICYKRGPIKTMTRCISKVEHKYSLTEFPTCAHLLDINRASLTFDNLPSLIKGINIFINVINSKSTCIKTIVRCKNGWNDEDFTDSSPTYSDIKFNVVIDIGNNIVIIGEIQFLLSLMEKFKKTAHQYYSIFRQQEFIDNYVEVAPLLMDKQYQLFTYSCNGDNKALLDLIVTYNISSKQLLNPHEKSGKIILSKICEFNHFKSFILLQTLLTKQEFKYALQLKDKTSEQWSPIGEALHANSVDIIRLLCNQYPKLMLDFHFENRMRGKHSLHFAAENGNIQYVKWYFDQIRDEEIEEKKYILQIKDENGYIPLHIACNYSQIDIIKYMMEWSANENLQECIAKMRDNDGTLEPLMLCCYKGNQNVVKCLLESVIDYKLRLSMILSSDKKGLTSLIYATLSKDENCAIKCASILMDYIKDSTQKLNYIQHEYNGKTAKQHTKNDRFKAEIEKWESSALN